MEQISGGIEKDVKSILAIYYKNNAGVTKEELIEVLEDVVIDISTIQASATMATKADFNLKVPERRGDIIGFFEDYIREIASKSGKWGVKIHFSNPTSVELIQSYKPAEISSLLVNILDNSRKAKAKNLWIICQKNSITFVDDGHGFDFETYDKKDFFRKGISTTVEGSGLGLFHSKGIASRLSATLSLSNDPKTQGAVIKMEFKS